MLGETISHYRIIEKLGEGGMGVVYRAVDTKLDREVAIKFLPAHLSSDPVATKRFIHEAKAASAIDHSNIGTIYEIDETDDGVTFIVMALYDGETLRERMDRGQIGVGEALDIASQIASGLSKAHRRNIVHRDIKPSNIIITSDGEVKIIDFGLAKLAGRTRLTKEASTLGTAAYMSPEQAKGEEVDHRSDIFSLGVILYEMLAGEPPFKGEHEAALLYEIVHESAAKLSIYRDETNEEIQRVIDKSLEKVADNRYQNMEDLLDALSVPLKEIGKQRTGAAHGAGVFVAGRTKKKWWRPVAFTLTIIALVVMAAVLMRNLVPVVPQKELAVAIMDFHDLGDPDDLAQSAGLSGLLHIGLAEGSPCRIISRELLYDLRRRLFGSESGPIKEDQKLELARKSDADVFLSGQMVLSGTKPYAIWKLMESKSAKCLGIKRVEGEDLSTLADNIIADIFPLLEQESGVESQKPPPPVSTMTTDSPEAFQHYTEGLLALNNKKTEEARLEFERSLALDSTFALAYYQLSKIYFYILGGAGQKDRARNFAEKAWEYKARLGTKDRLRLEAWREQINDRIQDALDICREMLLRWPDDFEILEELARRYAYYWYFEEGLKIARQGLTYYPDHYNFVYLASACLSFLGRRWEALDLARSYLEKHDEEAMAWIVVSLRYIELAMPDSAEIAARRALEIDPDAILAHGILSDCDYYRGDIEKAIEAHRGFLERGDLAPGQRVSYRANMMFLVLPLLHMEGGRFERALEAFEEARQFVSDPSDEILIETNLNQMLLRRGKAEEVLRRTQNILEHEGVVQMTRIEYVKIRALIALDSLQAARSAFSEITAREHPFGLAHLYPQDKIRAELALAEKDGETALEILKGMQRRGMTYGAGLSYIEWRETLADAYRITGRLNEAAEVHEKMLQEFRGHYISHYELGRIYEEMGRRTEALSEYELFIDLWKHADEGLPQLENARDRIAILKGV